MKHKISLFAFILLASLSLTGKAEAYFTTSQSATKLTDTTVVYTVTYEFGNFTNDTFLPISTVRNLMHNESYHSLGYTIRNDAEGVETTGDTAALVFAKAPIKNNMYYLKAGSAATFTLVTFFRLDETTPNDNYSLLVENLPFPTKLGEDIQNRSLNPSELKYYTTPEVNVGS